MPFRLRTDARAWFSDIKAPTILEIDFDIFYFCLMAGLATNRKPESRAEAKDLVNNFPDGYKKNANLILALFIKRELSYRGISLDEKDALNTEISQLVDSSEPTHLSELGMREVNRYASGGYEALYEEFSDKPRHLETFLPLYKKFLDKHLSLSNDKD